MMRRLAAMLLLAGACGHSSLPTGADGGAADGSRGASDTCTSIDQCFGATPRCDPTTHACAGCQSDSDCRGALHCDPASHECRDCVTDQHCTDPALPYCDPVSRQCSNHCTSDADCPTGAGVPHHCHPTLHVCVDCYLGPHCGAGFCETMTFSCVGCLKDGDCPSTAPMCGPSFTCTPSCTSTAMCPLGSVCDPAKGLCVECATNQDCPGGICQPSHTCA
jgi:hypothetical protein